MIKVCLLGCGAIGKTIAENSGKDYSIYAVYDRNLEKALSFEKFGAKVAKSFEEFERMCKNCDVAVEAASQQAVRDCVKLLKYVDLVVMSSGALSDWELLESLVKTAEKHGRKIYIPSGAIAGIDALKALKDYAKEVTLTTVKSPESLGVEVKERKVLFEGNALEAVKLFPANVNVSATLSLACLGFERTKVRIVADPKVKENIHEITAKGEFGEIFIRVKNRKHPTNPKTSYLAALSVIRLLKSLSEVLKVGT